jgi:hypothetical protein
MNVTFGKRALDRSEALVLPPAKRRRKNTPQVVKGPEPIGSDGTLVFSMDDCIGRIFSNLSFHDLVAFERAARSFASHTFTAWNIFRTRNEFPYWLACREDSKDKWSFVLSKALNDFVVQLPLFERKKNYKQGKRIENLKKFEVLGERFPIWGSFVKINILNRQLLIDPDELVKQKEIIESIKGSFDNNFTEVVGETVLAIAYKMDKCILAIKMLKYREQRKREPETLKKLKGIEPEIHKLMDKRVFFIGTVAMAILKCYRLVDLHPSFVEDLIEAAVTRKNSSVLNGTFMLGLTCVISKDRDPASFLSQIRLFLPSSHGENQYLVNDATYINYRSKPTNIRKYSYGCGTPYASI